MDQDGLACGEAAVFEQALPGGQPGDGQRGGHGGVDVRRQRGEVAGLHRGPVPLPVGSERVLLLRPSAPVSVTHTDRNLPSLRIQRSYPNSGIFVDSSAEASQPARTDVMRRVVAND
jgi:hypothetical protein